jgi:NifU-like protein involved in Fe-S cluster formation
VPHFDPLSAQVRRYFDALPGAGRFEPGTAGIRSGWAGDAAQGALVTFHLEVSDAGFVTRARFEAYGCPHTLAAAAWVSERLAGRRLAEVLPGSPTQWLGELDIPVEKLGRLLVVEDALRHAAAATPADVGA